MNKTVDSAWGRRSKHLLIKSEQTLLSRLAIFDAIQQAMIAARWNLILLTLFYKASVIEGRSSQAKQRNTKQKSQQPPHAGQSY